MNGNSISSKKLSHNASDWLRQLEQTLIIRESGKGTICNYVQEMTLLFKFYHDKTVESITQQDIEAYILFIKKVHLVGRAKCRSVAQACSFFFKRVMPTDYIVPSNLYPKKQFILPNIMTEDEIKILFSAPLSLKEYCVVSLCYGCGLRISEVCNLRIKDIDSANHRIKVNQGKGAKDRFTLLPEILLTKLREYFISSSRPKEFLFTSAATKTRMHVRSMQLVINSAMQKAGFQNKSFTAHTLRHSFATHMLNAGSNLHVIKTLLGHSKLETTMIYLHLQKHTQLGILSPLEFVAHGTRSK